MSTLPTKDSSLRLIQSLHNHILVLDGAMGTMLQRLQLQEHHYHLEGITPTDTALKGCNDILCLTHPQAVTDVHRQYLQAGARIISTDSFNANDVSLAEYHLEGLVEEINHAAVELARKAIDESGQEAWVAGSVGPTSKSLSMQLGLDDEADRVTFDTLHRSYHRQIMALLRAGADLLLLETVFDSLNAKAAILAAHEAMTECGWRVPIIISVTLTESGRTLAGQTLEAFVASIAHCSPLAVGLNCGFGAEGMVRYVDELQPQPFAISLYPNAGLPNAMGEYDESPAQMAEVMGRLMAQGKVNIVGGCCGTTPAHIAEIAKMASKYAPRPIPAPAEELTLAGLEVCEVSSKRNFLNIGERCNVAGSRKFLRLVKEGAWDEAVAIARQQVEAGAQVIDINMDDAMLDACKEMDHFLRCIAMEPSIARVPLMIDSSRWEVIESALKLIQGKPVVNSISLKEGEEAFLAKALHIHEMGAAMVVMAFDEEGQATTYERRTDVCQRAYLLLTENGIPPCDIIFDPNILTVATGIEEHNSYALDFMRATAWIKAHLPHAKVSGGLSNLSFAFRGNNYIREAMHATFLYHAIKEGMDMAIVNAATLVPIDQLDTEVRNAIEDVLLNRHPEATEHLIEVASSVKERKEAEARGDVNQAQQQVAASTVEEILASMIVRGASDNIEDTLQRALEKLGSAYAVIDGPLMEGMNEVGRLFGEGRMFLPQVVKSARTMRQAVDYLTPLLEADMKGTARQGHMVIATVKGDVHDIGKNIVDVVMSCNGFEMTDLGVMVPGEEIVQRAIAENADMIGLSGLITPSLEEMCHVARLMENKGLKIPLMIGGAGASALHTAVKIAPCYSGPVVYTHDAATLPIVARRVLDQDSSSAAIGEIQSEQQRLRDKYENRPSLLSLSEARNSAPEYAPEAKAPLPKHPGTHTLHIDISDARHLINWRQFFDGWGLDASLASIDDVKGCDHCRAQWLVAMPQEKRGKAAEAMQLYKDANRLLDLWQSKGMGMTARVVLMQAGSSGDDIMMSSPEGKLRLPTLRQQQRLAGSDTHLSLADFIEPIGADGALTDTIGAFAVSIDPAMAAYVEKAVESGDQYRGLMCQSVANRLAEAATEYLHEQVRNELWGHAGKGIRPAVGYPSLPDQSMVFLLDKVLNYAELGITLTSHGAMSPAASTTGLMISYGNSRYFAVGEIDSEQRADYASRRAPWLPEIDNFIL